MKAVNGVMVISVHCDTCLCKDCLQWKYAIKVNEYIRCPFEQKPCIGCDKRAYVELCVFKQ